MRWTKIWVASLVVASMIDQEQDEAAIDGDERQMAGEDEVADKIRDATRRQMTDGRAKSMMAVEIGDSCIRTRGG